MKIHYFIIVMGIASSINIKAQMQMNHMNMDTTGTMINHHEIYQEGSGTSWLPASAPMNAYMINQDNWMLMFHGKLFLRYDAQDIARSGSRGSSHFDAPDWFMVMAENDPGKNSTLKFSLMLSLDPAFVGGKGYPLLFQTGESWDNKPLVDRQHPHDLFSELSAEYTYSFGKNYALNIYLGYPGEPALGPVAFMHRPSAASDPDSPIGHHWQDATHITFGTATLGFRLFNSKIEGSVFNGREPDEHRYGFDKPKFDSYSGRITANPGKELSFQVSYGYLKSPEWLNPDESIHRATASVIHGRKISDELFINSSLIWGYNYIDRKDKEHSILLETDFSFNTWGIYGRYEWVQKSAGELVLQEFNHKDIFDINAITAGLHFTIFTFSNTNITAGIQGSLFGSPKVLESLYGKNPLSLEVYLAIAPSLMNM